MLEIITKKEEWDRTIQEFVRVDFYYFHGYHRVNLKKGESAQLLVFRDREVTIALPLLIRPIGNSGYFDVTSVYGYLGPLYKEKPTRVQLKTWHNLLQRYFSENRIVSAYSSLNPFLPGQSSYLLDGLGEIEALGDVVFLDLTKTEEELYGQYGTTTKRYVKRNKKLFSVREGKSEEDIQLFMGIYYQSMDRIQAEPQYYFDVSYFQELLGNPNFDAHFVFAHSKLTGEAAAGALIVATTGDIVQYHLSGTSEKYRGLSPIRSVIDHVRQRESKRGAQVFNLGGGVGSSHDSLYGFKASFSTDSVPFRIWKYIVDQKAYNVLCQEYAPNPNQGKSNYFPRYRSNLMPQEFGR